MAFRAPLPGQARGYRPPSAQHSSWGPTSPPETPPPIRAGHGAGVASPGEFGGTNSPPLPPTPTAQSPYSRQQQQRNQHRGDMQPRSPHATFENGRRTRAGSGSDGYGDRDDDGLHQSTQRAGIQPARQQPSEPYVRIRIVGLEKNRRDIYIKFNAEVSIAIGRLNGSRQVFSSSIRLADQEFQSHTVKLAIVPSSYMCVALSSASFRIHC